MLMFLLEIRKLFEDAGKLCLDVGNLDTLIERWTKSLALTYIHGDKNLINAFLDEYPCALSSTEVFYTKTASSVI